MSSDAAQQQQQSAAPAQVSASDYIVIGAGPVGIAAAIQLAKRGKTVTIYEGRDDIPVNNDNSYPIGMYAMLHIKRSGARFSMGTRSLTCGGIFGVGDDEAVVVLFAFDRLHSVPPHQHRRQPQGPARARGHQP